MLFFPSGLPRDAVALRGCFPASSSESDPPGVGKGVKYGPGLHANVVVAKCGDSMQLYRIAKRLARASIPTARSSLCALFHRAAGIAVPLYDGMMAEARADKHVHADETPLRVQVKGGCRRGWIWTLISKRVAAFAYDPSRSGEAAERLIGTGDGNLCVDGYSGYNESTRDNRTRSGYWAHARGARFSSHAVRPPTPTNCST
ncbi:MAG: transposase [Nannocystaceae bacterium]